MSNITKISSWTLKKFVIYKIFLGRLIWPQSLNRNFLNSKKIKILETSSALHWLALGWKSFWMGFGILIRIFIWSLHWSWVYPCSKFWLPILTKKVQRTFISFESWLGLWMMLEVSNWSLAYLYWFGYGYWSLTHLCSLSWFWRCQEHVCPLSLDLGLGGRWRFLTGVGIWSWFGYAHCSLIYPWSKL